MDEKAHNREEKIEDLHADKDNAGDVPAQTGGAARSSKKEKGGRRFAGVDGKGRGRGQVGGRNSYHPELLRLSENEVGREPRECWVPGRRHLPLLPQMGRHSAR